MNKITNKFVDTVLRNKRGSIEGQRLSHKWLEKHGHQDVSGIFLAYNITDTESLYQVMHLDNGTCSCESKYQKKFLGYNIGYGEYCTPCSRTTYNHMKFSGSKDVPLDQILEYVKDKHGNYSSCKAGKMSHNTIELLKSETSHLAEDTKIGERLYNFEHNIKSLPICKVCHAPHQHYYFKVGYLRGCKGKCSENYNSPEHSKGLRRHFYEKYVEKYVSTKEYDVTLFSLDDYLNKTNCIIKFTHLDCGHKFTLPLEYQGSEQCPKCFPVRSKIQYEIYDFLLEYVDNDRMCKFNDRKILAPKELDIIVETDKTKFAIEYDGIAFHSFGQHAYRPLDNTKLENRNHHLEKTDMCESMGIQLFRIFSNEWHNKEAIWKSVLRSKLGLTDRIFARKCDIKEISSKEANLFLESNHLQGKCSASIRIGLYLHDELVALMTFGKSRFDKSAEYELIRFCSKLNTSVVGGASKLLRHFERKYNPKSLISYANRRWSQGGLYNKLGFTDLGFTPPNYFYFKSGSNNLESRVKFQKHKLEAKLEIFDPKLTETQNMYNNGYRKIYDCGNLKYLKEY